MKIKKRFLANSIALSLISVIVIYFTLTSANAQSKKDVQSFDITNKVEGVKFKEGVTKVQEINSTSYIGILNKNGKRSYVLISEGKPLSPSTVKSKFTTFVNGLCRVVIVEGKDPTDQYIIVWSQCKWK